MTCGVLSKDKSLELCQSLEVFQSGVGDLLPMSPKFGMCVNSVRYSIAASLLISTKSGRVKKSSPSSFRSQARPRDSSGKSRIRPRHRPSQPFNRFHRRSLLLDPLHLHGDPTHPDAGQEHQHQQRAKPELKPAATRLGGCGHEGIIRFFGWPLSRAKGRSLFVRESGRRNRHLSGSGSKSWQWCWNAIAVTTSRCMFGFDSSTLSHRVNCGVISG